MTDTPLQVGAAPSTDDRLAGAPRASRGHGQLRTERHRRLRHAGGGPERSA
ncbi:hypothetical protein [Micromonospora sp. NPDC023956]|uniref:hypothetical protein n=1 Tax=Micromonospora sp. NPDC023956 TaxID=3155722 RepID=UPI0033FE4F17